MFFRGVDRLLKAGIPAGHIMAYCLIGYEPWRNLSKTSQYRIGRIQEAGIMPYPMVYNDGDPHLKAYQRFIVRRYDAIMGWEDYHDKRKINAAPGGD